MAAASLKASADSGRKPAAAGVYRAGVEVQPLSGASMDGFSRVSIAAGSYARAVHAAGDVQRLSVDKARRDFAPCAFVNRLHRGPGNIHLRGALRMGLLLQVHQTDDLVFVQRQQDRRCAASPLGAEGVDLRPAADPAVPWRS